MFGGCWLHSPPTSSFPLLPLHMFALSLLLVIYIYLVLGDTGSPVVHVFGCRVSSWIMGLGELLEHYHQLLLASPLFILSGAPNSLFCSKDHVD